MDKKIFLLSIIIFLLVGFSLVMAQDNWKYYDTGNNSLGGDGPLGRPSGFVGTSLDSSGNTSAPSPDFYKDIFENRGILYSTDLSEPVFPVVSKFSSISSGLLSRFFRSSITPFPLPSDSFYNSPSPFSPRSSCRPGIDCPC